jgi:hypothetical protein
MSDNWERYRQPYKYRSKLVSDGTVDKVKSLKSECKTFEEIGNIIGKSRQQASQIYYKAIAKGC